MKKTDFFTGKKYLALYILSFMLSILIVQLAINLWFIQLYIRRLNFTLLNYVAHNEIFQLVLSNKYFLVVTYRSLHARKTEEYIWTGSHWHLLQYIHQLFWMTWLERKEEIEKHHFKYNLNSYVNNCDTSIRRRFFWMEKAKLNMRQSFEQK